MPEPNLFSRITARLRSGPAGMFGGAVIFGVVAALLAGLYLKLRGDAYLDSLRGRDSQVVRVVVASSDLEPGTVVGPEFFQVRAIPYNLVSQGTVRPGNFDAIVGRVLVEPLARGAALHRLFVDDTYALSFSDTIDEGRRAMTIQVDELNSIGGLARPGDKIDVFVLLPPQPGDVSETVIPVLQSVRVLAAGQEASEDYKEKLMTGDGPPPQRFSNITIDVAPREGALVAQAVEKGDLITLLRNRNDLSPVGFTRVGLQDLIAQAESLRKEPPMEELQGGFYRDADGNVRTADGQILEGVTVDENGNVVTASGEILRADEIEITADGLVLNKATGELVAGVSASEAPLAPGEPLRVEFIVGGVSKDGVATVGELPVLK